MTASMTGLTRIMGSTMRLTRTLHGTAVPEQPSTQGTWTGRPPSCPRARDTQARLLASLAGAWHDSIPREAHRPFHDWTVCCKAVVSLHDHHVDNPLHTQSRWPRPSLQHVATFWPHLDPKHALTPDGNPYREHDITSDQPCRGEVGLAVAQRVLARPELAALELFSFRADGSRKRLVIRLDKVS